MIKPILFNTDMIRAIQADRKTVTRRVVKPPVMNTIVTQPLQSADKPGMWAFYGEDGLRRAPYRPGDILYVRETWNDDWCDHYIYKADGGSAKKAGYVAEPKWRPSIHMPREAARIFLRVTDVGVERLQEITPEQIDAEGCKEYGYSVQTGELMPSTPSYFKIVWDSTIKPADRARYGWDANPWVWVIEFERISREEAMKSES